MLKLIPFFFRFFLFGVNIYCEMVLKEINLILTFEYFFFDKRSLSKI